MVGTGPLVGSGGTPAIPSRSRYSSGGQPSQYTPPNHSQLSSVQILKIPGPPHSHGDPEGRDAVEETLKQTEAFSDSAKIALCTVAST